MSVGGLLAKPYGAYGCQLTKGVLGWGSGDLEFIVWENNVIQKPYISGSYM